MEPVPRIDACLVGAFQRLYDAAWDRVGMPVGSFRMAAALLPVAVDTGLELIHGGSGQCLAGLLLYLIAVSLLYRLQDARRLAALNAEARLWARRTAGLRLVYLALTAFSMLAFHHLGVLALVDVAYARCLQVRPRAPTGRSRAPVRGSLAAGLGQPV